MEYSASDLPPLSFAPPSNYPSPQFSFSQPAVNLPNQPQLQLNHPPYEEMIRSAVMVLNEKNGSSRQKIARYIENEFHVPKSPLHEFELTHNLRQMKSSGQLVLVRHSYMLPVAPPPQPQTQEPYVGPSVPPPVGPEVAPSPVSDGPGPKRKPVVSPTPTPSPPVGFAAFSPKQSGVPTTSLFGGLAPASYQFSAGPSVSMGLVNGSSNNASTMVPISGPPSGTVPTMTIASGPVIPSMGPVSNVSLTYPVTGHVTNLPGLVRVSVNNVSSTSPVSGPVSYSGPGEQINESARVVGTGLESSAGPIVDSAANDPVIARNNDGPLLVVSTGPDSMMLNSDGPSTVLGKRGRGRPPKIGGLKKPWGMPTSYGRRGRRGRPKKVDVPVSTISLRPRGRPRKNAGGAIVVVDGANGGGGGGALPVTNIPLELPERSLGRPNKDVPDTVSLTSEIHLMAYQGLKAKFEHCHTRIKSAVSVIRPCLNETEVVALGALQELEDLTNMDIISVPVNAQSGPAYVQRAPADDLNPLVNVQGAPGADLNAPVNVQDAATENIQSLPSTAEDAQLTFQGTPSDAETAQLTFQSAAVPVQGQQDPTL